MCLIVVAHLHSLDYPLVIAANRDELHARPTKNAHFWIDDPNVIGGLDRLSGGSWLAIARNGRWAAVTNLRAARPRTRSRGALVRDFVLGTMTPEQHASEVNAEGESYAGFHLLAGVIGEALIYTTPSGHVELEAGVHALSNASYGEDWPKTGVAAEAMTALLREPLEADELVARLMRFLRAPRGTGSPMSEIFVPGDPYGTRASTVIVATRETIVFAEQPFGPGGVPAGTMTLFHLPR